MPLDTSSTVLQNSKILNAHLQTVSALDLRRQPDLMVAPEGLAWLGRRQ